LLAHDRRQETKTAAAPVANPAPHPV
jgi:hypothetical protein